jgi:inosine/xanthosine triphosphate pyrophosphatase family protein
VIDTAMRKIVLASNNAGKLAEFNTLLAQHFANHSLLYQRAVLGSVLSTPDGRGWRSYERRSAGLIEATNGLARADYLIALASDAPLPETGSSIYLGQPVVHTAPAEGQDIRDIKAMLAKIFEKLENKADK